MRKELQLCGLRSLGVVGINPLLPIQYQRIRPLSLSVLTGDLELSLERSIAIPVHCINGRIGCKMYGTIDRPLHLRLPTARPRRTHSAAVESLLEYQRQNPWVYQDEMAIFLEEKWGITLDRSTISRLLKKHRISAPELWLCSPGSSLSRPKPT